MRTETRGEGSKEPWTTAELSQGPASRGHREDSAQRGQEPEQTGGKERPLCGGRMGGRGGLPDELITSLRRVPTIRR